ncbi:YqzL family protein [Oceanobacillus chungangensis]|uniref:YqzL family protein n=1 Tax=Oceanobacillus chungangensis TaxID=1229152 RepID=A0A3D8Q154_9BACI|nr:YqzL family protein [Oceanobacillus chungangensis]RDW21772.1 YqzL family protein [Oceanobacillus chungangensis]
MEELTWKLFSETGNIETYLLLKELENGVNQPELGNVNDKISSIDTNM